jgi:hypothetical protein
VPIEWAQEPRFWHSSGYGDILRYVSRYQRLDTYDLALGSYDNLYPSYDAGVVVNDKPLKSRHPKKRHKGRRV